VRLFSVDPNPINKAVAVFARATTRISMSRHFLKSNVWPRASGLSRFLLCCNSLTWLSGRTLATHARGHGFEYRQFQLFFSLVTQIDWSDYLTRRRSGLSASAELLVEGGRKSTWRSAGTFWAVTIGQEVFTLTVFALSWMMLLGTVFDNVKTVRLPWLTAA